MATLREKLRARGFESADDFIAAGLMLILPFLAVGLVTCVVVVTSTPDLLALWAAILVGIVGGTIWVAMGIATSGTDLMDVIVPCIITIILALILLPVGVRAKEQRLRKKQDAVPAQIKKQHPQQN